jgi:glutamine cyclotransferase
MKNTRSLAAVAFLTLMSILHSPLATTSDAPLTYGYKVTAKIAQPRDNFVQGLQIVDDHLYVSTGQYGRSRLLRYRMTDEELQLDTGKQLDARLFAEGLTILDGKIYQLTWKSRMAFIYNQVDLKGLQWFKIPGEGWGITNNGEKLIYSDGSHQLHFLSPQTLTIDHSIDVTENGKIVDRLNELEWINGRIWANVWASNKIVIIDPDSGFVSASIDLAGLLPDNERRADTDVLNGIAVNPADSSVWVTGKNWPWLYQIELVPPQTHLEETNYVQ